MKLAWGGALAALTAALLLLPHRVASGTVNPAAFYALAFAILFDHRCAEPMTAFGLALL
jgi:hypothetical protein